MPIHFNADEDELKVFQAETEEQLQSLDGCVVALERDPQSGRLLQEIFRIAHTIKGSSAAIGHNRMAELTHRMENLLDLLRQGKLTVTTSIVNALLGSVDALMELIGELTTGESSEIDLEPLLARISALTRGEEGVAPKPAEAPAEVAGWELGASARAEIEAALSSEQPVYEVIADIQADALFPAARALQVLLGMPAGSRVLASRPSQSEIEQGETCESVSALVTSPCLPEAIVAEISSIPDVVIRSCLRWKYEPEVEAPEQPELAAPAASSAPVASAPDDTSAVATRASAQSKTIRIPVERLDNLMNLVAELVIDRTRLFEVSHRMQTKYVDEDLCEELTAVSLRLERLSDELQGEIMKSRMLPIDSVFSRFPRLVRDLAMRFGKKVELEIFGQDTELDRSVIEEIGDPLVHLIRNSIDHGVENPDEREAAGKPEIGCIKLSARHEDEHIVIDVEDDGRGIDSARVVASAVAKGLLTKEAADQLSPQEALDLIFIAGLSTAKSVSEVSGRGVGMDIVRDRIERLNGTIALASEPGKGTRTTIRLPLTLAIIQALIIDVGRERYAIPLTAVEETLRIRRGEVRKIARREVVVVRGRVLPLVRLSEYLGQRGLHRGVPGDGSAPNTDDERLLVVSVHHGPRSVGLVVDYLVREQEIVIKPLDEVIGQVEGISGVTIMGDGRVSPILDIASIVKSQQYEAVDSRLVAV
jgi:two-component system, chemotaxis family, sensor kinase CheA